MGEKNLDNIRIGRILGYKTIEFPITYISDYSFAQCLSGKEKN